MAIAKVLNCALDDTTVKLCSRLILEDNVNPEALAMLIADLEREFSHKR